MKAVLSPAQMSAADRAALDSGTPTSDLMERAGEAVAWAAMRLAGGVYGKRFVIVCGKGNNAGDGFVAGRKLHARGGHVALVLVEDPASFDTDAAAAFGGAAGLPATRFGAASADAAFSHADVVIDALLGTGFRGSLEGDTLAATQAINRSGRPVLAVDIPSGVNGSNGKASEGAVRAHVTVTMAAKKTGLMLHAGSAHAGLIEVADIGLDTSAAGSDLVEPEGSDVAAVLVPRSPTAHKRSVGKVLLVAGSSGMSGAAVLAAGGALRSGTGLLRVVVPQPAKDLVAAQVPEAMVTGVAATDRGSFDGAAITEVLDLAETVDALVIGPGVTKEPETAEFIRKLLASAEKPIVLDADGISILAGEPETLKARSQATLITPHSGELARLMNSTPEEVDDDRVAAVRAAAAATGSAVLLKGFRTLVGSPDGRVAVIVTGGPILATAGSGDVLSGVAGSLSTAHDAYTAGWVSAWLHGAAGDLLASNGADRGVIASDICEALPSVIAAVHRDHGDI